MKGVVYKNASKCPPLRRMYVDHAAAAGYELTLSGGCGARGPFWSWRLMRRIGSVVVATGTVYTAKRAVAEQDAADQLAKLCPLGHLAQSLMGAEAAS